jgi:hypothetical protein
MRIPDTAEKTYVAERTYGMMIDCGAASAV